jgi:hypothetical protein
MVEREAAACRVLTAACRGQLGSMADEAAEARGFQTATSNDLNPRLKARYERKREELRRRKRDKTGRPDKNHSASKARRGRM